jgi:hypothetical protein
LVTTTGPRAGRSSEMTMSASRRDRCSRRGSASRAPREQRQPGRQHDGAQALGRADAHHARQALARGRRRALDAQERRRHGLDLGLQRAPGLGQPVAQRLAREERRADLLLQGLDAPRDGRVVDRQAPRRALQRAGAGEFEKEAQVVPVHARILHSCKARARFCLLPAQKCKASMSR